MGIDDRDYMCDRDRESSLAARRFSESEHQKKRQEETLKRRFASYLGSPGAATVLKTRWKHVILISLVTAIGVAMWMQLPVISYRFLSRQDSPQFPITGAVRWFIPAAINGSNGVVSLSITGLVSGGQNIVVRLDTWEARKPIAMIPIRSGETATLQVPFGRYRITHAVQGDVISRLSCLLPFLILCAVNFYQLT